MVTAIQVRTTFCPRFLRPHLTPNRRLAPARLRVLRLVYTSGSGTRVTRVVSIGLPAIGARIDRVLSGLSIGHQTRTEATTGGLQLVPSSLWGLYLYLGKLGVGLVRVPRETITYLEGEYHSPRGPDSETTHSCKRSL